MMLVHAFWRVMDEFCRDVKEHIPIAVLLRRLSHTGSDRALIAFRECWRDIVKNSDV